MDNIEALISRISYEIVSEKILDETEINKLLGVLSNNGVYAMWVYALDKVGLKFHEDVELLKNERIFLFLSKISEIDKFITNKLDTTKLINEIASLTKEINSIKTNIKSIKNELKKLKNEEKKEKEKELKQKENELKQKEKERIKKLNEYFIDISRDLHKLLFLKQLLEKTLIYARYHAKALGD